MLQRKTSRLEADDSDRIGNWVESLHDGELEESTRADGRKVGGEERVHRCELRKTGGSDRGNESGGSGLDSQGGRKTSKEGRKRYSRTRESMSGEA